MEEALELGRQMEKNMETVQIWLAATDSELGHGGRELSSHLISKKYSEACKTKEQLKAVIRYIKQLTNNIDD